VQRADALQERWIAAHAGNAMLGFGDDLPRVVGAILNTPLAGFATAAEPGGTCLQDVLAFSAKMQAAAERSAQAAYDQESLGESDLRTLYAGVALAFLNSPGLYFEKQVQRRFRNRMRAQQTHEVRGPPTPGPGSPGASVKERAHHMVSTLATLLDI
jgi:hypothetical protein